MTVLKAFNNGFTQFLNYAESIFPDDKDIQKAKTALEFMKKTNPKLIITFWYGFIIKHYDEIQNANIDFFLLYDYTDEVGDNDKILSTIDRFRQPLRNLDEEEHNKIVKYVQTLSKLSIMYMKTST